MDEKNNEMEDKGIVKPNCFGINLSESNTAEITMLFGNCTNESGEPEIKSRIILKENGFKVVLKRMLDTAEQLKERFNIDILEQIVSDYEKEGAKNGIARDKV